MYAIVETGGKQVKVAVGDKIYVEKLDAEEGKEVTLDKVLFIGGDIFDEHVLDAGKKAFLVLFHAVMKGVESAREKVSLHEIHELGQLLVMRPSLVFKHSR